MSRRTRLALALCLAFVGAGIMSSPAYAQSAISGVVKDESGAVMPGVSVEAASDALIEKVRAAVTDENGAYRMIDLRPGKYVMTFTLQGFNVIKRELELPSNFVATINAELAVGTLQESVTVSGQSPLVDVQSNVKQQVMTREVLDAVPTARTIQGLGQLVPGVTFDQPDVGGSRAMQQTYFFVRGSGSAQTVVMVDGLMTNGLMGDGAVNAYHNEAMTQEAVYMTSGGNAETMTAGVNLNLVPKDGGNRFTGGVKYAKSPADWQGDNLSDELKSFNVKAVDKVANFYEFNLEQGGPILRDKLWFFGAFRKARYDKPIANTFDLPTNVPAPQAFAACLANIGSCEQGISPEKMNNPIARFTWQASQRNKFSVYMDRAMRLRAGAMSNATDPRTASVVWNTPTFATGSAKWTSTLSSSLLFESGFSFNRERYDNLYQPGILAERNTPDWYRNVRKNDLSTGFLWNASSAQLGNYPDRYTMMSALSYVTGSHTVKVGGLYGFGIYRRYNNANGDLYQTYTNGVPTQVTVLNTPLEVQENMDGQFAIYAQDSWRRNNFTFNYGIRYDRVAQSIVGQKAQVGRFANVPAYDDFKVPTWSDFSPRTSVVWDIFGNGKTAIRTGFNRFMTAQTTGFARLYAPTALTTANLPWSDINGDDIAQGERGCTYLTAGCEINFANLPANFGLRALATPDADIQRPGQYTFNLGVTQEVMGRLTLTAEWYHNRFTDITERNNVARTFDSYAPVSVVSPLDGSVITAYNVKPEFRTAVQNVDTSDKDIKRHYNGFELGYNVRLPKGARVFGGFNLEKTLANTCSVGTDPNLQQYCNQWDSGIPWSKQFKLAGTYPLPFFGLTASASLQSLMGYVIGTRAIPYGVFTFGTGFDVPNGQGTFWQITPTTRYAANCTGPCRPGELVVPGLNSTTLNVLLKAPETEFMPRYNQLDLSLSKTFRVRGFRVSPKVDVFNAMNSDRWSSVTTAQFGTATYLQPSTIMQARLIRVGIESSW
jgi:Carboxypeptidase regulatory-like domain/TonB-dependent Receptor Plug Domain